MAIRPTSPNQVSPAYNPEVRAIIRQLNEMKNSSTSSEANFYRAKFAEAMIDFLKSDQLPNNQAFLIAVSYTLLDYAVAATIQSYRLLNVTVQQVSDYTNPDPIPPMPPGRDLAELRTQVFQDFVPLIASFQLSYERGGEIRFEEMVQRTYPSVNTYIQEALRVPNKEAIDQERQRITAEAQRVVSDALRPSCCALV